MKFTLVFLAAIAALFTGGLSLECYYCNGPNCSGANPTDLQVETCKTGYRNYQSEAETMPETGNESSTASGITEAAESTTAAGTAEGSGVTSASTEGTNSGAGNGNAAEPSQEEATTVPTTTTTTKKPCFFKRPIWANYFHGSKPMCVNSTTSGILGSKGFRGCVYTKYNINPCYKLRKMGMVRTCNVCTTNRCN